MNCPYCGNPHTGDAAFCGYCGRQIPFEAPKPIVPVEYAPPKPIPPAPDYEALKRAPKAASAEPVEYKPLMTREQKVRLGFSAMLCAFYIGLCLVVFLLPGIKKTISVGTLFDKDVSIPVTLQEFTNLLRSGNRIFHPTVLTTGLGLALEMLRIALPLMALLALAGAIWNKKSTSLFVCTAVTTGVYSLLTCAVVPVTLKLVPGFDQAFARQIAALPDDLGKVTFLPLILYVALTVGLLIGAGIILSIWNKRRAQK